MTADTIKGYTYDAENRTTSVTSSGATTATYTYDGDGIRVMKATGGVTTIYVFSGSKVIAEYAPGALPANPIKEYVYAGTKLLATLAGSTVSYAHPDHLSTRLETAGANGSVTRAYAHYPFGEDWYETGSVSKQKFTSYERDAALESGLDYAMARYHSSRIARFMSPDLLAGDVQSPQSLNKYSYTFNDPIDQADPAGLEGNLVCTGEPGYMCAAQASAAFWGSAGFDTIDGVPVGRDMAAVAERVGFGGGIVGGELQIGLLFEGPDDDPSVSRYDILVLYATTGEFAGVTQQYQKIFDEGMNRAKVLLKKTSCLKLLGANAAQVLDKMEFYFNPLPRQYPAEHVPGVVQINTQSSYVVPDTLIHTQRGDLTLSRITGVWDVTDLRAMIILHELGHEMGKFGMDSENGDVNADHTKDVRDACVNSKK